MMSPENRPIRWGLLGAGRVARDFAEGLRSVPDARLVAVASRTSETLHDFGRLCKPERLHASYDELVSDDEIDIIYVSTPHHRHAADALSCIKYGKAVLCEKPFTLDALEARTVVAEARRRGVFCMEAMWTRSLPLVRRLRTMVAEGAIGDLLMVTADFSVPTPFAPDNRFFDPTQGGGALLDRGVYGVSLASMLMGRPDFVSSHASMGSTGVDEQVVVVMQHERALAQVTASLRAIGSNEAFVMGTRGTIRVHAPFYRPERMTLTPVVTSKPEPPGLAIKAKLRERARENALARQIYGHLRPILSRRSAVVERIRGNGYNYEAVEAQRCLRSGLLESPDMTLDESIEIMEAIDRARATWSPG